MDKTLIYGLFETLTVSAAGSVYQLPADILNKKNLKIYIFTKNKLKFLKNKVFSKNRLLVLAACR
jgi:hypothetical protein